MEGLEQFKDRSGPFDLDQVSSKSSVLKKRQLINFQQKIGEIESSIDTNNKFDTLTKYDKILTLLKQDEKQAIQIGTKPPESLKDQISKYEKLQSNLAQFERQEKPENTVQKALLSQNEVSLPSNTDDWTFEHVLQFAKKLNLA